MTPEQRRAEVIERSAKVDLSAFTREAVWRGLVRAQTRARIRAEIDRLEGQLAPLRELEVLLHNHPKN